MSAQLPIIQKRVCVKKTAVFYDRQLVTLQEIAKVENVTWQFVMREMLDSVLPNYLHRKGTFSCQKCGKVSSNKKRHDVTVDTETFSFGDCCYFNDSYKEVVKRML